MTAGYSGTPLARKLGIKEGHRVWLAGPPDDLLEKLEPLPEDVAIQRTGRFVPVDGGGEPKLELPRDGMPGGRFDVILIFCPDGDALRGHLGSAVRRIRWTGGLWVCWPKKSSSLYRDLAREEVREVGLAAGLVDNKVCAVDDDWSGLRFVVRTEDRPEDRKTGGPSFRRTP